MTATTARVAKTKAGYVEQHLRLDARRAGEVVLTLHLGRFLTLG